MIGLMSLLDEFLYNGLCKKGLTQNVGRSLRRWQDKGWHIALHGYDHVYISENSGLEPFNNKSEFAGLSY